MSSQMNPEHYKYMPRVPGQEPEPSEQEEVMESAETQSQPVPEVKEKLPDSVAQETAMEAPRVSPMAVVWMVLKGAMQFIYDIFNPFLVLTYSTLLVFELSILALTNPGAVRSFVFVVFGATCLFPVVGILLLRLLKVIRSVTLFSRRERIFPYLLAMIGIGAIIFIFYSKNAPQWMLDIYIGAVVTVFLNFLVNFYIKISNHASALAGALSIFFAIHRDGLPHFDLIWWVIGTVILAGIIGALAIIIGRHSVRDVFIGYATGFLPIILFSLIN